jgi:hypothetical protein
MLPVFCEGVGPVYLSVVFVDCLSLRLAVLEVRMSMWYEEE